MTPAQASKKFLYGRHETFPVRYGWLSKGLQHLRETGWFRAETEVADRLGLGSKMTKSLQFWLEATGLAEPKRGDSSFPHKGRGKKLYWAITPFGSEVARLDPHFEYPATWWFLHMSLARRTASVWGWFFNEFHERRFDRRTCVDAFLKYASDNASKQPSLAVAQRDVACLIQAYASPRGSVPDPEDATACPLRELELVVWHRDTERYEKSRPLDAVPSEVFLSSASAMSERERVSLADLMSRPHGPARILGLGRGQIEEMAENSCDVYNGEVQLDLIGSERGIVLPSLKPETWLARHFERIQGGASAA